MTTEIAIMNGAGVVLAADSAGTVTRGQNQKVSLQTDKIFELCTDQPIGLMVYNGLEFLNLPIGTVVKKFRHLNKRRFETVTEAADAFVQFLEKGISRDLNDNAISAQVCVFRFIYQINEYLNREFARSPVASIKEKSKKASTLIKSYITEVGCPIRGGVFSLSDRLEDQISIYTDLITQTTPLTPYAKGLIKRYCRFAMHSSIMSDAFTGVVIAGFGDQQLVPEIVELKLDGMHKNKLRLGYALTIPFDKNSKDGVIKTFAQDDVVQRFVTGIDPHLHGFANEAVRDVLVKYFNDILVVIKANQPADYDQVKSAFATNIENMTSQFKSSVSMQIRNSYERPIQERLATMSKPEMAQLAEALVETTSLHRRFSWVSESVGGEVDVAVISKSEGFVWVKRKFYFDSKFNPRQAARVMRGN